ncbi:hypothetical protein Tco_0800302 [Tanacetum coccineum]|uniref:Uncharacterized protein n=1 Tax=Tanacetum coccineum TaxID=301880 RepID=A0ABQ4ZSS3_9ASTR
MILPVFSSFYNNPCLKDVQAFYAKELPISSPDPITSPATLTPLPRKIMNYMEDTLPNDVQNTTRRSSCKVPSRLMLTSNRVYMDVSLPSDVRKRMLDYIKETSLAGSMYKCQVCNNDRSPDQATDKHK